MTTRLREETPIYEHFWDMPNEITHHILTSCDLKKGQSYVAPHYLSQIARVCKTWHSLMHDIAIDLLNKGEIRLVHIPFIANEKKKPDTQAFNISIYARYLNGQISQEEVHRLTQKQLSPHSKIKTFQNKKLTYLDLTDLRHFDYRLQDRIAPLFTTIETLVRGQCSFKDTLLLPKFTQLKSLNITPNYNTDFTFIETLEKLEHLTLRLISKLVFDRAWSSINKNTSVSSLALCSNLLPPLEFTEGVCLPNQLKTVSLKGFKFTSEIFEASSDVENLKIENTYLNKPASFESFGKLKHLFLQIRENITSLTIRNMNLDSFELTAISLKNLNMENCSITKLKTTCPLLENTQDDS